MLNTITTENKQTPEIHINLCRMRKYTPPPKKKVNKNLKTHVHVYRYIETGSTQIFYFVRKELKRIKKQYLKEYTFFSGKNCQYTRFMLYVETTRCLTSFSNRTHVQFPHCASFVFIISGFF